MSILEEITVGYIFSDENALASCVISLDEERSPLPQTRHGVNIYEFGKIGSHNIAMCCTLLESQSDSSRVVFDMMHSFPSIKLLILVNSNAGAVPRDVGEVHVGDVIIAQKLVKTNRDGELEEMDLVQASGLLATTGMNTGQRWSLDEDIAMLAAKNNRWGKKCRRPAGDDVDKLDKIFTPRQQHEPVSMVHCPGVVISNPTYPEHAESRDCIAGPGTFVSAKAVCFDHSQTAGLPLNNEVVDEVSVLGVSNYCDEDTERDRNMWTRYSSMAAAACARKIVMKLATEAKRD